MKRSELFSRHARDYSGSASFSGGKDLSRLIELMNPGASWKVLDVATGTGFTAFAVSRTCSSVTGMDTSAEMLAEARRLASESGSNGVSFIIGSAEQMPVADRSIDFITCRRAAHHFAEKDRFLSESARILTAGGGLGIVDMLSPDGFVEEYNRLERLRDDSHETAEDLHGWLELVEASGFRVDAFEVNEERQDFEKWATPLELDGKAAAECRRYLQQSEPDFAEAISLENDLSFVKRRMVLICRKA